MRRMIRPAGSHRVWSSVVAGTVLAVGIGSASASASLPRLAAQLPRSFGYHVGDPIVHRYTVEVPRSYELQRESLPKVGDLNYWLELRRIETREGGSTSPGARSYVLTLRYQTFYAPLDVRKLQIPGFTLRFAEDGHVVPVRVPPWSFTTSPTLQIVARGVGHGGMDQDFSMPDEVPRSLPTAELRTRVGVLIFGSVLWLGFIARRVGWWRPRARTPFARGLRAYGPLRARGDDTAYREALRVLHRALDATYGRPLFAETLPDFLRRYPAFAAQSEPLARFFEHSRRTFFGDEAVPLEPDALFEDLGRLLRECRRAERRR